MNYQEIERIIKSSSNVFLMGHKGMDLDAFGSVLGMYYIALASVKDVYIIIDEENHDLTISKAIEQVENNNIFLNIIKTNEAIPLINSDSLLIILDVNKVELFQSKTIFKAIKRKIVLDHHSITDIRYDSLLFYVDHDVSSTCEIVGNMLEYFSVEIPSIVSSIMLGGIMIDTNNFKLKTTSKTYEIASYLSEIGASNMDIQYILKEDINEYFKIQSVIDNVIIVLEKYAFCRCDEKIYDKEFLAKISSILITLNDIEISFTIGKIDESTVGVSCRSTGSVSASYYMEKLNGGGNITDAASQIKNESIENVLQKLIRIVEEENE